MVVAGALLNALKVAGKKRGSLRIVINGAGAAGTAIAKLLIQMISAISSCAILAHHLRGADWLTSAQVHVEQDHQ